jgi:flagellar hook-associated protein 2
MAIRMSGMVSGMDTESIIKSLMEVQTTKKTKVENEKTKHEWKQEKWAELNTKIYDFYTNTASKLRLQGSFNTKKATSNNDSKVAISASTSAVNGTSTLQVNKLASSQYVTSAKLTDVKESTKLESLGFKTPSVDENGVNVEGDVITIKNGTNNNNLYR